MRLSSRRAGIVLCCLSGLRATAVNPIIQTIYTADPAPFVYKGTLYLYTGHDENNSKYFTMKDWHVFSTKDMANWTDLGSPLSFADFTWAKGDAWAGQAIERNGRFYWYVPMTQKSGAMAIGVAVGDSPIGPFKDALGRPLVHDGFGDIDPTVFIDKDDQAYLGWGNPVYKWVKLNRDMISYDTTVGDKGIFRSAMTTEEFGPRADSKRPTSYEEGPWLYARNGLYYNIFAAGPIPEHLAYSTARSPGGPWRFGGIIMSTQKGAAFTNHPGVVDYKGRTFLFYHNGMLPGGGGFDRSVAIEELKFDSDGIIRPVVMTEHGPDPVATLDPYQRNEAATIAWESGVRVVPADGGSMAVEPLRDGAHIEVRNVDFGKHASRMFTASVLKKGDGAGSLEVHRDNLDGPLVCRLSFSRSSDSWQAMSAETSRVTGIHDLYLVFRLKADTTQAYLRVDWWRFTS